MYKASLKAQVMLWNICDCMRAWPALIKHMFLAFLMDWEVKMFFYRFFPYLFKSFTTYKLHFCLIVISKFTLDIINAHHFFKQTLSLCCHGNILYIYTRIYQSKLHSKSIKYFCTFIHVCMLLCSLKLLIKFHSSYSKLVFFGEARLH